MKSKLRSMKETDIELVLSWRNNPNISKYMYNQHLISLKEHKKWFFRSLESQYLELLIFELDDQREGFMQFKIDHNNQKGEWGFYLSPNATTGVGSIMGNHGLKYAFEKLQLEYLFGEAMEYNEKSIKFHRKLGFTIDKSFKKTHFDGKSYHNIIGFKYPLKDWEKNKLRREF